MSIRSAMLGLKITPTKNETELEFKSQPCRIFDGLLCYLHFYASCQLLIFHVIIKVPDRVYRESHYRKDENLGLFGLQMNEWPRGTVDQWLYRLGSDVRTQLWKCFHFGLVFNYSLCPQSCLVLGSQLILEPAFVKSWMKDFGDAL